MNLKSILIAVGLGTMMASSAFAQGTAFTYQGRLNVGTNAATGVFDLRFGLWDSLSGGTQQGNLLTNSATAVTNGLFTVQLDFGGQFPGAPRWLETGVRSNGAATVFSVLAPRQPLTPTPYAILAATAASLPGVTIQQNSYGGPNVILGSPGNSIANGVVGGTISGGGSLNYFGFPVNNSVTGIFGTVGGGSGNTVSGNFSTVPGGNGNLASGANAFAAGYGANATNDGAFVWSDFESSSGPFYSLTNNSFNVRAQGGVRFVTSGAIFAGVSGYNSGLILTGTNAGGIGMEIQNTVTNGHNYALFSVGPNFQPGVGAFALYDDTIHAYRLIVGTNGNVGIGTLTPATALQVNGTVMATNFAGKGSGLTSLSGANIVSVGNGNDDGFGGVSSGNFFVGPAGNANTVIGLNNTAYGAQALAAINEGAQNTAIGFNALIISSNGSGNIALGNLAGDALSRGDDNIYIGNEGNSFESDTIRIGTPGTQTATYLAGTVYASDMTLSDSLTANTLTANASLIANTLGVSGTATFTGNVGVGTSNPQYGLVDIEGGGGSAGFVPGSVFFNSSSPFLQTAAAPSTIHPSLYASGNIMAGAAIIAQSDQRIKRIIGHSDPARDLAALLGIEVTDYTYIDTLAKGNRPQKKVIAQQVEKVFPQAVSRSHGEIPDIYKPATIKEGWVYLTTDLKVGERVKLITEEQQGVYPVLEVRAGAFRTDFTPATGKVFVYGRQVDDLRVVDYDAIAMLNVSATQELAKELAEQQAENAALKTRLGKMEEHESHIAAIEQEMAEMKKLVAQMARDSQGSRLANTSTHITTGNARRPLETASLNK